MSKEVLVVSFLCRSASCALASRFRVLADACRSKEANRRHGDRRGHGMEGTGWNTTGPWLGWRWLYNNTPRGTKHAPGWRWLYNSTPRRGWLAWVCVEEVGLTVYS